MEEQKEPPTRVTRCFNSNEASKTMRTFLHQEDEDEKKKIDSWRIRTAASEEN
jgi:hypothetical protein